MKNFPFIEKVDFSQCKQGISPTISKLLAYISQSFVHIFSQSYNELGHAYDAVWVANRKTTSLNKSP